MKFRLEIVNLKTSKPFSEFFFRRFVLHRNSLFFAILSVYLSPFTLFYLLIIYCKKILIPERKLKLPVISVGNIISGGTGKTPLVMSLIKILQNQGKKIIILSSGVDDNFSKSRDEILMISKKFHGLTFSSKKNKKIKEIVTDRYRSYDICVIDDGFHCHHIHKDLDILVVDMSNPFDNNMVIPSGLLREPIPSIRRADIFILTHPYMVNAREAAKLRIYLEKLKKPVFVMDYEIECLKNPDREIPPETIQGRNIIAIAGIGNPLNFFHLLLKWTPERIYGVIYPDHFRYRDFDIHELYGLYIKKNPDYIVTTEKDYVKLQGKCPPELPLFYIKTRNIITNTNRANKNFDAFLSEML